jgi:hypothetical protein
MTGLAPLSHRKTTLNKHLVLLLLSSLVTATFWACSTNLPPAMIFDRVKNRGPLALSPVNQYLVANQYLLVQRERCLFLEKFLHARGEPSAIEIQKPLLESHEVFLYYPESGTYYSLDDSSDDCKVFGPFKLSEKKRGQIKASASGLLTPPR